jgi:hypothetical protein
LKTASTLINNYNMIRIYSFLLLTFILGVTPLSTFGQTVPGSAEYMDELSPAFDKIKVKTWDYLSIVAQGRGAFLVESSRQSLLIEIMDAKEETMLAPSFNGNDELRQSLITYFNQTHTILKEDYAEILDMETIADGTYDAMEAYLLTKEKANRKLDEAYYHLLVAQKKFADDNKLIIHRPEEDEMTKKIENTGAILAYYNKIYLIFFRVFKQESLVMNAIQNDDLADFQWNIKILEFESKVALEKLALLPPFKGDASLLEETKKNMEFYYREATVDAIATAEYYENKKLYAAAKAEFEKIPQEDLVQADADKINSIGRAYNEAVAKFHAMNRAQNVERVEFLNSWNQVVEQFFKTNSI